MVPLRAKEAVQKDYRRALGLLSLFWLPQLVGHLDAITEFRC